MATLTEVSGIVRKSIKWGTISLIIMALIPGTISMIKKIYLSLNPPPPPPPTVRYGKLPRLIFPEVSSQAVSEYKLETISGTFPALPNVAKVHPVGVNKSRLMILQRMTGRVKVLSLTLGPDQLDDRTYRYTNPKMAADLIFDTITESFSYRYDWTSDATIYSAFGVPQKAAAEKEAEAFFRKMSVLHDDLADGPVRAVFLTATTSAMMPAGSIYEANFTRVDLFRNNLDGLPFVTAGGDTSPVNAIISGLKGEKRIVQANYFYSQLIGSDSSTYPLKPVESAWKELVAGGGYIARKSGSDRVVIRKVYLAYYESDERQDFLQPVYVFEGDGGFMAYIQAVSPEYVVSDSPAN